MKHQIILLRRGNRIYIRDLDLPHLKPLLELAGLAVQTTEKGKYTGAPRHYLPLDEGFSFFLSLTTLDYEIIFR